MTLCLLNICRGHHEKFKLDDSQSKIKIARRNINNFIYVYETTLRAESEEELKGLLMRVKQET